MDGLVAAATAEGKLNVIALPPDWANYGEIITAFQAKYPGIEIESQQPDASSAQEITAAQTNKGTDKAPDVFDLGPSVALQNVAMFAPYKVADFDQIPAGNKEPTGVWVNDYTGLMSVGYNATKFGELTSLSQLTDPKFASTVALNGNPTEAGAAFNGVVMAALANGGSAGRHLGRRRLLQVPQGRGHVPAARPDRRHRAVRPDRSGLRLVLQPGRPDHETRRRGHRVEGLRPGGRRGGLLLRPGDQRRRPAPGRGAAVAGVPLHHRRHRTCGSRAVPSR